MLTEGEKGRGINWEIGTKIYKKQVTNKDLLYITRKSAQYFVMAYKGKESQRE